MSDRRRRRRRSFERGATADKNSSPYPALAVRADNNVSSSKTSSSSTTEETTTTPSLLIRLAASCNRHQAQHKKINEKTASNDPRVFLLDDDEANIPDECRDALTILAKVLPKIETTFDAAATRNNTNPSSVVENVGHVCDFYCNVLQGGFCPHAPHLLRLGKGGTEIFPRVFFFLRHFLTRSMMAHTVTAPAAATASSSSISRPATVDFVMYTVARLLSFVPEASLQQCILSDWIQLAMDCSVLVESGILLLLEDAQVSAPSTDTTTTTTTKTKTTVQPQTQTPNVELLVLQETLEQAAAAAAVTGAAVQNNHNNTKETNNNVLLLQTHDELLSLQAAVLGILDHLVKFLKKKHSQSLDDAAVVVMENNNNDDNKNALVNAGLHFGRYLLQHDSETLSTLLGALRQALLTWVPPPPPLPLDGSGRSKGTARTVFWMRSKLFASNLLVSLVQDWDRIAVPAMSVLMETVLLVARATVGHLRYCCYQAVTVSKSITRYSSSYARNLAMLLCNLVLEPPRVEGIVSRQEVECTVHRAVLPILVECFRYIQVVSSPPQINDQGKVLETGDHHRVLEPVVLRVFHAMLRTLPAAHASSLSAIMSPDQVENLVQMLTDPLLSSGAVWIVSAILGAERDEFSNTHRLVEIGGVYSALLSTTEATTTSAGETNAAMNVDVPGLDDASSDTSKRSSAHLGMDASHAKRQKIVSGKSPQTASASGEDETRGSYTPLCFVEEKIASFLVHARRSAERLRDALQAPSAGANGGSAEFIPDATNVSSAVRLLLSLLLVSDSTALSGLSTLAVYLMETMVGFCRFFRSSVSSGLDHAAILSHLVSIAMECGAFAHYLKEISERDVQEDFRHSLETLIDESRTLFMVLSAVDKIDAKFPQTWSEALANFAIHGRDSVLGMKPLRIKLFPEASASLIFSRQDVIPIYVQGMDFCLNAVTDDDREQASRMAILEEKAIGSGNQDKSAGGSLQQRTFDLIKSVAADQSDPFVRLLRWQSTAWLLCSTPQRDLRRLVGEIDTSNSEGNSGLELVMSLMKVAFADPSPFVRDYASREVGNALSANKCGSLAALLADDQEWDCLSDDRHVHDGLTRRLACEHVAARLFKEVDRLLHEYCSVPQSQLSFTVGASSFLKRQDNTVDSEQTTASLLPNQRSAVRALSMYQGSRLENDLQRLMFEQSLKRVVSLSAGAVHLDTTGLCFGELSVLCKRTNVGALVRETCLDSFTPSLFRDVVLPSSGFLLDDPRGTMESISTVRRERQYRLLCSIIQCFLLSEGSNAKRTLSDSNIIEINRFFEANLHYAVAQFIVEKDYDALKLTTGFRLFLLAQIKSENKLRKRNGFTGGAVEADLIVGEVIGQKHSKSLWNTNLEDQTQQLCLAPVFIERILPLVFMRAGRSELVFFTRTVLQNKMPLKNMITSREQLILKGLIWELGRDPDLVGLALRAIRAAAIARSQDSTSLTPHYSDEGKRHTATSLRRDSGDDKDTSAATDWVSSHFMYLLVNVIQYRWSSRTVAERKQAVRCLAIMMQLLRASESSQYFPQIMATVNAAIAEDGAEANIECNRRAELKLYAVQALSQFVRLVAQHQWETLGQNLTTVVVSLIPVLPDENDKTAFTPKEDFHLKGAKKTAVSLLEWLTQGELGEKLAPYFKHIPFLPPSPVLDPVRSSLRAHGVDFDNLDVITTQGTQLDNSYRDSLTSDGGSTGGESLRANARRQAALRRRLGMVCSLLSNENASIRRVALEHLTALLRANRELFHSVVDNEGATSMKRYVTVAYPGPGLSRGTVTEMVETLLARCVQESDAQARILLATCFGEVGAIGSHRLDEETRTTPMSKGADKGDNFHSWRLSNPPWHSRPARYELQLVTKLLVVALKAAPTSGDQHKIAFSIQQLLVLLDRSASESSAPPALKPNKRESSVAVAANNSRPEMNVWLASKLSDAGVIDVVEPFWYTEFHEPGGFTPRQPPFFQTSDTYYAWISNWSRFMVHRANESRSRKWSDLFYACRTAIRTQAGLSVAEFLLPILILDRLCFGNTQDELALVREMHDTLAFDKDSSVRSQMNHTERQKAVSAVFMVIDTLQLWAETETENRHKNSRGSLSDDRKAEMNLSSDEWPLDESVMRIEDLLQAIPLSLRAHAAAKVGMHARALRFLEMAARESVCDLIFNGTGKANDEWKPSRSRAAGACTPVDLNLMKDVLAALYDYETMAALLDDDQFGAEPMTRARDSIRQKEASGDWEGALQDYERAQQLSGPESRDSLLQRGALRCLLELGQFESVLNQVNGIICPQTAITVDDGIPSSDYAVPLAAEAAWRLGRWEKLSELVSASEEGSQKDPETLYQFSLGKVMLGLKKKDSEQVSLELRSARSALMNGLSSVARESYSRAYDHIVGLQALREIEDTSLLLCSEEKVNLGGYASSWGWDRRLEFLSSAGAASVIKTRLALSQLASDTSLEGSLFLSMGQRARKSGLYNIATNSFARAEAVLSSERQADLGRSSLQIQIAKLKHDCGESSTALRMLGQENIETMSDLDNEKLYAESLRHVCGMLHTSNDSIPESQMIDVFVRRALLSTRWMMEGGLKGGAEIMGRFRIIHRLAPKWEKGHFQFAKYIDSILESRIMALQRRSPEQYMGADEDLLRSQSICNDRTCQRQVLLAVKHYAETLSLDTKHVYQALPRLLSLWFDFTSIRKNVHVVDLSSLTSSRQPTASDGLSEAQEEANAFMAKQFKNIPAQAFYTAIPQLVSRVIHDDKETALVVRAILKRVLTKFPAQAMWPLAWLRQSRHNERRKVGDSVFHEAEKALMQAPNQTLYKLLVASKSLFSYLQDLAKYTVKDANTHGIRVKPWRGEVDLLEFIPPIQAALSVSLSTGDSGRSRDLFPRQVPRMRTFAHNVDVMGSKARPKKLRAFVVSADTNVRSIVTGPRTPERTDADIGEIHFLVKQEAKGDLRKDARVQDLNNVINRLMASSNASKGATPHSRRLHLRTFAVTCLSEDTGILEWIPNTQSLRSLVAESYNPQASPFSSKRRGRRLSNFGEPMLRSNFEKKCQTMFFTSGNLKRAAAMFEELCLKPYPPLLYWWFVQHYHDPHGWYEARTRFTLSSAAWSAVGHMIGLGDRHSENILVDTVTGSCVHVDFDCIFDKGLNLPKPEVVPFRLTQNMLDAFGPTGADGVYVEGLKTGMATLRDNRDTLLSVLEPFVKDPVIDWKRYRSQQKQKSSNRKHPSSTQERQTKEAKRSINVIDERLKGIYNLRNPNLQKIRRTDGFVDHQGDDDLTHLVPLSVEGQVHKMIAEATSHENLVQLYVGWMPWV